MVPEYVGTRNEDRRGVVTRHLRLMEHYPDLGALLEQVEEKMAALASAETALLDEAGRYVVSGPGKRLRPALLLLAAETCGGVNPLALDAAAVVELIHTASLVHDDILDESAWRRGKSSARTVWGNKVSVLVGDYLLCRAACHLQTVSKDSMMGELLSVTQQMCQSQVAEMAEAGPSLSESRYLEIIAGKTASLMGLCCWMGAQCRSSSAEVLEALQRFGTNFGMAFQIADDIHDLIGSQQASGKPVNHDLRQRKVTLPLIFCLRQSKDEERSFLERALSEETLSEEQLAEMRRIAISGGGVDYAWSVCRKHLEEASRNLESLTSRLPALQTDSDSANSQNQRAYQALLLSCGEAFPLPIMA